MRGWFTMQVPKRLGCKGAYGFRTNVPGAGRRCLNLHGRPGLLLRTRSARGSWCHTTAVQTTLPVNRHLDNLLRALPLQANEEGYVVWTNNRYVYFYAELEDGSVTWYGKDNNPWIDVPTGLHCTEGSSSTCKQFRKVR